MRKYVNFGSSHDMGCITGVGNANLLQVVFVLHFFQVARLFYVLQLPIQLGYDKNIHYTYHCTIKDIVCILCIVYTIQFMLLGMFMFLQNLFQTILSVSCTSEVKKLSGWV